MECNTYAPCAGREAVSSYPPETLASLASPILRGAQAPQVTAKSECAGLQAQGSGSQN